MKCEIADRAKIIEDYLTGGLSREEREAFDEHCFNCDDCFQELRLREELAALVREEGRTIFADYLENRKAKKVGLVRAWVDRLPRLDWQWQPQRWVYATVAVAVVAVLCFLIAKSTIFPGREGTIDQKQLVAEQRDTLDVVEPEQLVESQQPVEEKEAKLRQEDVEEKPEDVQGGTGPDSRQLYAENFLPSEFMEEMLVYSARSYAITVQSPKIGENVTGAILFQWQEIDQAPIYLKILNNQAAELYRFTPDGNQFLVTEALEPGLYYWKLESEEDVLFVGKFFVEE